MEYKEYFRQKLPHFQPKGKSFFVTFCLKDAVPKSKLMKLKYHYDKILVKRNLSEKQRITLYKKYIEDLVRLLNERNNSSHILRKAEIAKILKRIIQEFNHKFYKVYCYTIMSNHVHLILNTSAKDLKDFDGKSKALSYIMKRIKGKSSREINILINSSGSLWLKESFDHLIRNHNVLHNLITYILNNPVKAGYVSHWKDYEMTYVDSEILR